MRVTEDIEFLEDDLGNKGECLFESNHVNMTHRFKHSIGSKVIEPSLIFLRNYAYKLNGISALQNFNYYDGRRYLWFDVIDYLDSVEFRMSEETNPM